MFEHFTVALLNGYTIMTFDSANMDIIFVTTKIIKK